MQVFVIVWTLSYERPNYSKALSEFINRLDAYHNALDIGLDSVRFIESSQTAEQIFGALRKGLEKEDSILVSRLNDGEYAGQLTQETKAWISARLL